jgi:hypothetical protein
LAGAEADRLPGLNGRLLRGGDDQVLFPLRLRVRGLPGEENDHLIGVESTIEEIPDLLRHLAYLQAAMEILTEHPDSLDETCEEVDLDLQGFLSTTSCGRSPSSRRSFWA